MSTKPSKQLETFPNPHPDRDYIIEITAPEFTCLCPKTGQPDFATLHLEYVPDKLCVELKALKLYVWSYRNEGHFHEDVTNRILNDLVAATQPRYMRLRAEFYVRGGIFTNVEVEHRKSGWQSLSPRPELPRDASADKDAEKAADNADAPTRAKEDTDFRSVQQAITRSKRGGSGARAATPAAATPAPAVTPAPPPPPPAPKGPPKDIFVGLDVGTTGCRACAINAKGIVLAETQAPIPQASHSGEQITQDPTQWWKAVTHCLQHLFTQVSPAQVHTIAVDGTSGTFLLTDDKGNPVTPAIMYNDQRATAEAETLASVAGIDSGALGASSTLAKLLWLQSHKLDQRAQHLAHQADWVAARLTGVSGHSDYSNCLKLGFDQQRLAWPDWFKQIGVNESLLPQVHAPGEQIGTVGAEAAKLFNLTPDTIVVAGATDGVASFIATGASKPGHGVTSLGSTLVLKLLSDKAIFSAEHGIYSHRLGKYWLAGGASNSGGAVLLQYFKVEQMREMTPMLDPQHPTDLDYYPLPDIGERFPIADPSLEPKFEPLPADSVTFFQGILEGIARIETMGYEVLHQKGAPKVSVVWTTGGGAQNAAWTRIRERMLGIKTQPARSLQGAYGSALIASGIIAKTFQ